MRRALSAENIAEFALSTLEGLKRFIPRRSDVGTDVDETDALPLMCKTLEEKAVKGMKLEPSELTQLMEMFSEEAQVVQEAASPTTKGPGSPGMPGDSSSSKRSAGLRKTFEALAYFVQLVPQLYEASATAVAQVMWDNATLDDVLTLMNLRVSPKQLVDACWNLLLQVLSESPTLFSGCAKTITSQLLSAQSIAPSGATCRLSELRLLLLLHNALRLADVTVAVFPSAAKDSLVDAGLIQLLLSRARHMQELYSTSRDHPDSTHLATGLLSLMVINGLFRGVPAHKEVVSGQRQLVQLWSFFVSNIDCVEFRHTTTVQVASNREEEHVLILETAAMWASDLAEFWIELATADSISLRRQPVPAGPVTNDSTAIRPPGGSFSPKPPRPRWEPWPQNIELLLTSASMTPWRFAAAVAPCLLSVSSAKLLLSGLTQLDIQSTHAASVYRGVIATLLLLCRACPQNSATLSQAGAFETVISLMSPRSAVFSMEDRNVLPKVSASESCWNVTSALLASQCATHFGQEQLRVIVSAIEKMVVVDYANTTAEDCSIIEQCACVLASETYPRYSFWFDGVSSRFVFPVERFTGRWFGYSFVCWVCTSCVWPEGAVLYAFSETSTPSGTALCIVANTNSKCLAIRSTHSKEVVIAVLPDTNLDEEWNHIAAVHNISGFTVYVNGKKACSTSMTYPKEPPKPHRLTFCVGGAEKETNIPSLFGSMTTVQFVEGALQEKDIERMVLAGPGATIEPPLGNVDLLCAAPTEALEVAGTLAKPEWSSAPGVVFCSAPRASEAMLEEKLIPWAISVFKKLPTSGNRSSVIILCIHMVAAFLKQHRGAVQQWADSNGPSVISSILLQWTAVPPEVVCSLFLLITQQHDPRILRQHPSTSTVLTLILDIITGNCPPITRTTAFRELSDFLVVPENARLARENPGFPTLMESCREIESECIDSFIAVVEKLVKEPNEIEYFFRFLILEPPSIRSTIVKCELLRMLYDVAKPQQQIIDIIVNAGGVQHLLVVISNAGQTAESLRVYAIRLLALILHCNKKQRDAFLRSNGFEWLAYCMSCQRQPGNALVGLPTYNALFKFSLDFFQPANDPRGNVLCDAAADFSVRRPTPNAMFGGHMPSMVPRVPTMMQRAVSLGSVGSSDCGDLETRLSVDDAYNSRAIARDTLVYPQCLATIMELLGESFTCQPVHCSPLVSTDSQCVDGGTEGSEIVSSSNDVSTTPSTTVTVAVKVLSYLDRMVDLTRNAVALLPYTWLEWLWSGVSSLLAPESATRFEVGTVQRVEILCRSIIRKIAVVDLSQPPKQSHIKRIKELSDLRSLQCMVLEEIVKYFTQSNRLNMMDEMSASYVLRNLDSLLLGIDECVLTMPRKLVFEIADAVSAIAVHNNNWVRNKMKAGKLFDTRNGLSFMALTSTKELEMDPVEMLDALTQANAHDPNAMLHLLKILCDAVKEKSVERMEVVLGILRSLYAHDDDHRRVIAKLAPDSDIVDLIVLQRKVVEGTEVETENVIFWAVSHEGRWEQFAQRVMKAYRSIESDLAGKADRREKEQMSKLKVRKAEAEKRIASSARVSGDIEKLKADWSARLSAYHDAVKDLTSARASRRERAIVSTSDSN